MYSSEVKFHTLINTVPPIKDKRLAEFVALEMYLIAYGPQLSSHPWATCMESGMEENPYYYHLRKYISLYKKMRVHTLGISLQQFMDLPSAEMLIVLESLSEHESAAEEDKT